MNTFVDVSSATSSSHNIKFNPRSLLHQASIFYRACAARHSTPRRPLLSSLYQATMPRIVDLPNEEVLERFMESFLPDDIDDFSISCKQFYALSAAKIPKHKEMKNLYAHASCSRDGSGSFAFEHPVFLIQTLFEDPHIVSHVKPL